MTKNIIPESAVPFCNIYVVDVTPELAASWLSGAKIVWPISERQIERFADEMAAGRWRVTHMGIAFDVDGKLIDGRHRLLAVVRSGKAVSMLVVTGEPPENANVIDNRNIG